jgi:hypothetical protein
MVLFKSVRWRSYSVAAESLMNMIEKVARAICKEQFGNEEVHGEYRCCQVGGTEGCCAKDLEKDAKAAIEAMREPTEAMIKSVTEGHLSYVAVECGYDVYNSHPERPWHVMIDAALDTD